MKISVLTSRVAKDDLERIKAEHSNIVRGIEEQRMRVEAYNQQEAAQQQAIQQQEKQYGLEQQKLSMENDRFQQDYDMRLIEALK